MLLVFEHKYIGASDVQHDYYCNIYDKFLPADNQSVGYCKYYKNYFLDKEVYIEFLYINEDYRHKGYATAMVKELQSKYDLLWDGRFTRNGRLWYEKLIKKGIVVLK
jgi:ribosomal protein S18 acetylase RimI-like enzyme